MKKQPLIIFSTFAMLTTSVLLSGCTSVYTVTDSVTLYPDNATAQKWGVINFFSQYQSNQIPSKLQIHLPNGKTLNGQLTYVQDTGRTTTDNGFWNNVHFGFGIGSHGHHGGFGGVTIGPQNSTYQSDKSAVSINAFGDNVGLNCQGAFNQKQRSGTVNCELTNGMKYRGTVRRVVVK